MINVKILHNPKCSTSREAIQILKENGVEYDILLYLTKTLSYKKIENLIRKLDIRPINLIRKSETLYREQFADKNFSDEELIQTMVDHPVLIERPILIKGSKAIIGRPVEKVFDFLKLKK